MTLFMCFCAFFGIGSKAHANDEFGSFYFETVKSNQSDHATRVVTDIVQDHEGYIWIGTPHALIRYDGYRFKEYTSDDQGLGAFKGEYVVSLLAATDGSLYIGTNSRGVHRYDPDRETFTHTDIILDPRIDTLAVQVFDILEDHLQGIWIATNHGLYRRKRNEQHYLRVDIKKIDADTQIRALIQDKNGKLWIGYDDGLVTFDFDKNEISYDYVDINVRVPIMNKRVTALFEDKLGQIWLGTNKDGIGWIDKKGVIHRISPQGSLGEKLMHLWVPSITQDFEGNIWAATIGEGIVVIDPVSKKVIRNIRHNPSLENGLNFNWVYSFMIDESGLMWIGTWGGGLNRFNPANNAFRILRNEGRNRGSLDASNITAIFEKEDGDIWLGIESQGINIINTSGQVVDRFGYDPDSRLKLADGYVMDIFEWNDGSMIVATKKEGLYEYLPRNKQFLRLKGGPERPVQIRKRDSESVWVAAEEGLYIYRHKNKIFTPVHLEVNDRPLLFKFVTLEQQQNGTLWVATHSGGYIVRPGENKLVRLTLITDSGRVITDDYINGLVVDRNDDVWFVDLYDIFKVEDVNGRKISLRGMGTGETMYNILEDDAGRFWSASKMYDPSVNKIFHIGEADGVDVGSQWVNSYRKSKDGFLYYGGAKGLLRIDPSRFEPWEYQPPLVVTDLKVENIHVPVHFSGALEIQPDVRKFTFEYSSLDFSDPRAIQYAHKLEGYDKDWTNTDNDYRVANYTNLDPGQYTLKLKGTNRGGVWSDKTLEIPIIVLPAWYQTWWATLLGILALFTAFWAVYWYRLYSIKAEARHLESEVEKRTKEIAEKNNTIEALLQKKNEVFANVSHEFKTPLTIILGRAQQIENNIRNGELNEWCETIIGNGKKLLRMVNQLLELSKIDEHVDEKRITQPVIDIAQSVVNGMERLAQERGIEIACEIENGMWVNMTEEGLETILVNLISNAIKYSDQGGRISISITHASRDKLELKVNDKGRGIDETDLPTIFERFKRAERASALATGAGVGLSLVKNITEAHGGSVNVHSKLGEGSTFIVRLPLVEQPQMTPSEYCFSGEKVGLEENALIQRPLKNSPIEDNDSDAIQSEDRPVILLIEDSADMQAYLNDVLKDKFATYFAGTGELGLDLSQKLVPDLIVCDYMLPGIQGPEVVHRVKNNLLTAHIPILMLTAKHDRSSKITGIKALADEYMTKPFDTEELLARIHSALEIRDILKKRFSNSEYMLPPIEHGVVESTENRFINRVNEVLEKHYDNEEFNVQRLAEELALSVRPLQRKFKATIDLKPSDYIRNYRLNKAKGLLQNATVPISEVSVAVGFSSQSYFSTCFKAHFGMTPKEFRLAESTVA